MQCRRPGFDPWVRKIPWRRKWQPSPVFLPWEFHGQRSLAGYNPWGPKESDTTERLTGTHWNEYWVYVSLQNWYIVSCMWDSVCVCGGTSGKEPACQCRGHRDGGLIPGSGRSPGEGNGNPLQCSCLENPMDRGAWRATVHGVTESETTQVT